jgi:diaminopimelate epimerase
MGKIKFSKLNGQGNDFVIIDDTSSSINLSKDQIAKICHRNFGIGADGLILVRKSTDADFKMDYYNQDGSVAEMCGNGIRCMARFIHDGNLSRKKELSIETLAGVKRIFLNLDNNNVEDIRVDMGLPDFKPENIPVDITAKAVLNYRIKINSNIFYINCVSMGNPHCVILINKGEKLSDIDLDKLGPELENHPIFPRKTNAEFVDIKNNNEVSMRVWERGVGETLACGTGACAAAVCVKKLNKISGENVRINLPGGKLDIMWKDEKSSVYLKGKVEHVFNGIYFL